MGACGRGFQASLLTVPEHGETALLQRGLFQCLGDSPRFRPLYRRRFLFAVFPLNLERIAFNPALRSFHLPPVSPGFPKLREKYILRPERQSFTYWDVCHSLQYNRASLLRDWRRRLRDF